MKVKYSLKSLKNFLANAFSGENPEKVLEDICCELTRRNFTVELYRDASGRGIWGNLDIYPSVLVNAYIPYSVSWELQVHLFFEDDDQLGLVCRANPAFREKVVLRRYSLPVVSGEIARALSTDALLIGATLETIRKREEIQARSE